MAALNTLLSADEPIVGAVFGFSITVIPESFPHSLVSRSDSPFGSSSISVSGSTFASFCFHHFPFELTKAYHYLLFNFCKRIWLPQHSIISAAKFFLADADLNAVTRFAPCFSPPAVRISFIWMLIPAIFERFVLYDSSRSTSARTFAHATAALLKSVAAVSLVRAFNEVLYFKQS